MKLILIFSILIVANCPSHAQRFFYLESDNSFSKLLKYDLIKYSQFVTETPLVSDYMVKMKASLQTATNKLSLNIYLQDSITLETIYQSNEEYTYGGRDKNSTILLKSAVQSFVDRNIDQIVIYAKEDHYNDRMRSLKPKKDKT